MHNTFVEIADVLGGNVFRVCSGGPQGRITETG